MKSRFHRIFLAVTLALSIVSLSSAAEAYQCRWVKGYTANGYYHQGHKVCWHNKGYNRGVRHCGYRNGHRVCWYR